MEIEINQVQEDIPQEKKKRGRKPKPKVETDDVVVPKKRGRKPKGGKIIEKTTNILENNNYIQENVILHLKCNSEDILKNNDEEQFLQVESLYKNELKFQEISDSNDIIINDNNILDESIVTTPIVLDKDVNKDINKKIKDLQKRLYYDESSDKKSACFHCTYEFDHQPIHIPKFQLNNMYYVYGCFCSPECGVSYLMNEIIDTSEKYERFQLLNYIYGSIFDYSQNIKPAPNPYYTLDKFYGNMSIQEYRRLLKNDRLLLIVDKPLTRVLPEIYEETDIQFTFNTQQNPQTTFQIKKQSNEYIKKKNIF